MTQRIFHTLAIALTLGVLCGSGSLYAADDAAPGNGKKQRQGGPAGMASLMLQHADELGLTADQKTKLEEFSKGPLSILTDEQKKKAKEIIAATRPDAQGVNAKKKKDADPEADKKPDAPGDKKPDTETKN